MAKGIKRLVLFDAHAIIHRAYHALPEFASKSGEPTGALYGLSSMLIKIINDLKPDYMAAAYDLPGKTFRHEAYDEYKAGRAKADPALISQLNRSRDIFKSFDIPIYDNPGFEADDILGTIVEQLKKDKDIEIVIASGDMDTMQLVDGKKVQVYTLKKGINDTILYDEKGMIDRFGFKPEFLPDYKGLRGDPSDNIIGVKGVGEKTATDLISNFGSVEEIYKIIKKTPEVLIEKGIKARIVDLLKENEEEALFSKTLAQIRKDAPIKFALPKQTWIDAIDLAEARKIFKELDFKSLIDRFEKLVNPGSTVAYAEDEVAQVKTEIIKENIESNEIKKVGIALWLINSENTTPTQEDILDHTGVLNFKEAESKIFKELKEKNLEKVYQDIELPLISILEAANKWGILINQKYFHNLSEKYHEKLSKLEKSVYKQAGVEFNLNSPKQLGEILFDRLNLQVKGLKKTAGGARSTRESELEKLKAVHPIIEDILLYRELQKIVSTYVDTIPNMVDDKGRLHTELHQAGTTTGRMSSSNPNLQNIPARGDYGPEIRKGFVASVGTKWVACDYSQIEMRIMALFSEDENLISIFQNGEDVHAAVASRVFGVSESEVTSDQRRAAKVINFGIIYGMGVNALKDNLGSTRAEAELFYNNYFEKFPKIRNYFEKIKEETRVKGYTETLFGRRRYFPGIKSKIPFIKAMAERMAINAPLQGTAADIIKIAMHEIDKKIKERKLEDKVRLLLQVHDELIYEVDEKLITNTAELIKTTMENAIECRLPLSVNLLIGDNWGDMKSVV